MKSNFYKIYALSENALTIQLDSVISEKQIRLLYHIKKLILDLNIHAIHQILVTFHELTVLYDFTCITFDSLQEKIQKTIDTIDLHAVIPAPVDVKQFVIPICYDEKLALDGARLENHTGLSLNEIIQRHHGGHYTFFMMGFLPGFLYLGGLDHKLSCPRLAEPRQKVSAGSVGIAGGQTGIYPMESPGGWNIIGRTPLTLFDFDQPSLNIDEGNNPYKGEMIQPLDNIIFSPISLIHFQKLKGMTIREYQQISKTN